MRIAVAAGLGLALAGCADDGKSAAPVARLDLRAAFGTTADITPIGLAIAPDGRRYVFDETLGLYRIDGTYATEIVSMAAMPSPGPMPVRLPFTDIVAIAPDVFAITAIGDGYLLDINAQTLTQHFCYVPDGGGGAPVSIIQRTDGIAYDVAHERIFAQPITYDAAGVYQYGQIAGYDRTTGADVAWYSVASDIVATGMVVLPDGRLVMGQGWRLTQFDQATSETLPLADLYRFGVRSIDGIAVDPAAGTLVIVDKVTDALFDIDLAQVSP